MGPFATVAFALEVVFWFFLLAVAAVFVTALVRGTIEEMSDKKRIVAARLAQGLLPPSAQWQRFGPGSGATIDLNETPGFSFRLRPRLLPLCGKQAHRCKVTPVIL